MFHKLLINAMFKNNLKAETKIAVLEERINSHENVMNKIEEVIQVMSETSQNVSKMLAVHEERLEYNNKTDQLILDRIKGIEEKNLEENKKIISKLDSLEDKFDGEIKSLEEKIEDVSRIKWMTVGTGIVLAILIGAMSNLASGYITKMGIMENVKTQQVDK